MEETQLKHTLLRGNTLKHLVIAITLIVATTVLNQYRADLVIGDTTAQAVFLAILGILWGGAMAGALAFTYKDSILSSRSSRLLGHFVTGVLIWLLVIILSIFCLIAFELSKGSTPFWCVLLISCLGYTAIVGYDYWDLLRFLSA